jgi:hypothetical protein
MTKPTVACVVIRSEPASCSLHARSVVLPVSLRRVTRQANVGWAIGVFVVIGLIGGITSYATLDAQQAWFDELNGTDPFGEALAETFATAGLFLWPIMTPLIGAFIALVLHGMARLFKGQGRYRGLFAGLAFAYLPNVLNAPLQLLSVAGGLGGAILAGLLGFGVFAWIVILTVIAVRENYALSTGKSAGVVLIPIAAFFVLAILLVIIILALVFAAFAGV